MKKKFNVISVLVLILSMLLISPSDVVHADVYIPPSEDGLADGSWSAGVEVDINLDPSQYPGLQLLTRGVKISQPAKLCHEFRGGDYGWVADIRMFKKGVWVKQATTTGWEPDTEGKFMACTDASAAGTYALFGWFDSKSPKVRRTYSACDSNLLVKSGFSIDYPDQIITISFEFQIPSMPNTLTKLVFSESHNAADENIGFGDTSKFIDIVQTDKDGNLSFGGLPSDEAPDHMHAVLYTPSCYFVLDPIKKIY